MPSPGKWKQRAWERTDGDEYMGFCLELQNFLTTPTVKGRSL